MLKSGENGLIGPGSNDYGRSEPYHSHKAITSKKTGKEKDLFKLNLDHLNNLENKLKDQELIISGIEEGAEQ